MPTVWVTQEPMTFDGARWRPKYNLSHARSFGEVRVLAPGGYDSADVGSQVSDMCRGMADYREGDLVVLLGDPVLIAAFAMGAAAMGHRKLSALKWDRDSRRYYAVDISINPTLLPAPQREEDGDGETGTEH